jgi:hypothetical protein
VQADNADLRTRLEWFKRQVFGLKSERRETPAEQMDNGESNRAPWEREMTMTKEQKIIRGKVGLLELAKRRAAR